MELIINGCFSNDLAGWEQNQLAGAWMMSQEGAKNSTPLCPDDGPAAKWGPPRFNGLGAAYVIGRIWQNFTVPEPGAALTLRLYWITVRGDWADVSIIHDVTGERHLLGVFGPELGRGWQPYEQAVTLPAGAYRVEIRAFWTRENSLGWKFNGVSLSA